MEEQTKVRLALNIKRSAQLRMFKAFIATLGENREEQEKVLTHLLESYKDSVFYDETLEREEKVMKAFIANL
jgi:predicted transposase YdaD